MSEFLWPVVPIQGKQLLDVRPEDLLEGGRYRKCNTYRGGGGYDQFPHIARYLGLGEDMSTQFVVQLKGCHLACHYCYVTQEGIWGDHVKVSTDRMILDYQESGCNVFHLMGGAPALYLPHWPHLIRKLADAMGTVPYVFHSDLLLTEAVYDLDVLGGIVHPASLYAVSVKGFGAEHLANTGVELDEHLFWENFTSLVLVGVPFYVTFTNVNPDGQAYFWKECESVFAAASATGHHAARQLQQLKSLSFSIDLIKYKALE